jgi:hypothetical protein
MVFGICQCGSFSSYPHIESCPYPMFRNDPPSVKAWEKAHAELVEIILKNSK